MYKLTLGHVHDLLEVQEGKERIRLRVDADPADIVRMINRIEPKLNNISGEGAAKEAEALAREFCGTIMGKAQTDKLFELYNGSAESVLDVCSRYFTGRLAKLITKAQKKARL